MNILVIRPDAIGDTILTLPAIQAIKDRFPQSEITVLARPYTEPLLAMSPAVSRVISDYELGKYRFDLSINYFNQPRDTWAAFKARIPSRLGDSARLLTGWMNNLRVFRRWNDFTRHEMQFNFDLLEPLGIKPIPPKIKLNTGPSEIRGDFLAGIHVGSGSSHNKAWNNVGLSDVINFLQKEKGATVVLTGSGDAAERAEKISLLCRTPPINLVGKLNLPALVNTMTRFKFYLGTDTGPTHLAAALAIPMVALFVSKASKPLHWGPWGTRHLVIKNRSRCERVCHPPECTRDIICVNELSSKEVIAACDKVIAGGGVIGGVNSLHHWCQQSFSIALLCDDRSENRAQELAALLAPGDWRFVIVKEKKLKKLMDILIKEDINILHCLEGYPKPLAFVAQQLTGTFLSNRALLIGDGGAKYQSDRELINYYIKRFNQTVF